MTEPIGQRPCSLDFYNLQPVNQRKYFKVVVDDSWNEPVILARAFLPAKREGDALQSIRTASKAVEGRMTPGVSEKPPVWKGGRTVTVTFDHLPPTELHPNYQETNFWAVRARVSKAAREEANLNANIHATFHYPKILRCEITEIFTFPTKRRIDLEGCMVACKPWIDGLVDAGLLVDDDTKHVVKITGIPRYVKGVSQTEIVILEVV